MDITGKIKAADYARQHAISPQAVAEALKRGVIDGFKIKGIWYLDPATVDATWQERVNKIQQRRALRGKQEPKQIADSPDIGDDASLSEAQRVEKVYKAKLARLAFEEQTGALVAVDKIQRQAFEAGRKTRDAILNIPDRIAHELAAEVDPHKIHNLLTSELTKALEELTEKQKHRDKKVSEKTDDNAEK